MFRGDLVLVNFPFTDLSGQKLRPALVVGRPIGEDLIVSFITSRGTSTDPRAEYQLPAQHPEFASTGLKAPSLIRLNKLATLDRKLVTRRIGHIGQQTELAVARGLRYVLGLS